MLRSSVSTNVAKISIRLFPLIALFAFIVYFEWSAWNANSRRKWILSKNGESNCDPEDAVCKQCPFFRENVDKMNKCVREIIEKRISFDDSGYVLNSIPYAVSSCNLEWAKSQRILQLISEGDTKLVLAPANRRAPLTAVIIGDHHSFEMERQLAENMTRSHFYALNLQNNTSIELFKRRLNGTILHKPLNVDSEREESDPASLTPDRFFQKYFPRRTVDIAFIHSLNVSRNFIDQLMGKGVYGLERPICQLNVDIPVPLRLDGVRPITQWFNDLATTEKSIKSRYVIGYSTLVMLGGEMRLRFYAINVGQPKCVAKFLEQSECRPLIGSVYDD